MKAVILAGGQGTRISDNRSADLQRTLAAFLDAGFTGIRLHVLDNVSTDETASVVV
ncbi:MAG: hypothetical protein K8H75_04790 [Sulfuricella sp.]|nr:hypothetical protein [Sulfuricella sp.]